MRSNSVPLTALPVVASGPAATSSVDVGRGFGGFSVQLTGVGAAAGVLYALEGSLDGLTWFDLTISLRNLVTGAAVAAPIAADGVYDYPTRFPGLVRIACRHAPTSPGTAPSAVVAYQDSTQA